KHGSSRRLLPVTHRKASGREVTIDCSQHEPFTVSLTVMSPFRVFGAVRREDTDLSARRYCQILTLTLTTKSFMGMPLAPGGRLQERDRTEPFVAESGRFAVASLAFRPPISGIWGRASWRKEWRPGWG